MVKMPYSYYQFMRIVVCSLFIWLAYLEYQAKSMKTVALYSILAILFNPIDKIYFKKPIWVIIDELTIAILLILLIIDILPLLKKRKTPF